MVLEPEVVMSTAEANWKKMVIIFCVFIGFNINFTSNFVFFIWLRVESLLSRVYEVHSESKFHQFLVTEAFLPDAGSSTTNCKFLLHQVQVSARLNRQSQCEGSAKQWCYSHCLTAMHLLLIGTGAEVFPGTPYSCTPDLAMSAFWLLTKMKHSLRTIDIHRE
jgi:hypothetical protein